MSFSLPPSHDFALRRLRDLLREVEGGYAHSARITVSELAHRWLSAAGHRVSSKTYAGYAAHVRLYIEPQFGLMRAETLRPAHIEAALATWANGKRRDNEAGNISARTIAHVFNTLRTLLRWAAKMGAIVRNPADAVEPPRFIRKEMKALNPVEVAALLGAASNTELQAAIAVAIGTGLHRGELLGLRWADVDLEARRLTVRRSVETVNGIVRTKPPKTTRSARTIALPPFMVDVLRRERVMQARILLTLGLGRNEADWVFLRGDGSAWEPGAFSLAFRAS